MTDLIGRALILLILPALLGPAVAIGLAAAAEPTVTHTDKVCGFQFSYPAVWRKEILGNREALVHNWELPVTRVAIDSKIIDVAWSTREMYRQAVAAQNSRDYFDDSLVWRDAITVGQLTVVYVINAMKNESWLEPRVAEGTIDYFRLTFFIMADGAVRNLSTGQMSLGSARAHIPVSRYRQNRATVMAIVSSLRYLPPQRSCRP